MATPPSLSLFEDVVLTHLLFTFPKIQKIMNIVKWLDVLVQFLTVRNYVFPNGKVEVDLFEIVLSNLMKHVVSHKVVKEGQKSSPSIHESSSYIRHLS